MRDGKKLAKRFRAWKAAHVPKWPVRSSLHAWCGIAGLTQKEREALWREVLDEDPPSPLDSETARRIADHHEARLPAGYESIPIIDVWDPEPAGVAKQTTSAHHGRGLSREEAG